MLMNSSHLNEISDQSEQLNNQTEIFAEGLFVLARYWGGDSAVAEIRKRIKDLTNQGLSPQEAMSESYQYVKSQIFKNH